MKPTGATAVTEKLGDAERSQHSPQRTLNLADHLDLTPESVVKSNEVSGRKKFELDKLTTPSGDSKSTTQKGISRSSQGNARDDSDWSGSDCSCTTTSHRKNGTADIAYVASAEDENECHICVPTAFMMDGFTMVNPMDGGGKVFKFGPRNNKT